jgi:hypothetical protein
MADRFFSVMFGMITNRFTRRNQQTLAKPNSACLRSDIFLLECLQLAQEHVSSAELK